MELDLSPRPDVRYIRAKWDVSRWNRAASRPLFTLYLLVHSLERQFAYASA